MDHRSLLAAIATITTALHLLAGPCTAAARPLMGRQPVTTTSTDETSTTSALALAPTAAAHHHHRRAAAGGDEDAGGTTREGKWLPFAGAHHLPAAYWAHKPVPWVGAGGGELVGGGAAAGAVEEGGDEGEEEEEVVRGRERHRRRPSYDGDGTTTSTRQEQLAMWASLLNPKGRGRSAATGWLPAPGIGEAADEEPAKASDTAPVEGVEGDESSASGERSQNYWGNNGN